MFWGGRQRTKGWRDVLQWKIAKRRMNRRGGRHVERKDESVVMGVCWGTELICSPSICLLSVFPSLSLLPPYSFCLYLCLSVCLSGVCLSNYISLCVLVMGRDFHFSSTHFILKKTIFYATIVWSKIICFPVLFTTLSVARSFQWGQSYSILEHLSVCLSVCLSQHQCNYYFFSLLILWDSIHVSFDWRLSTYILTHLINWS